MIDAQSGRRQPRYAPLAEGADFAVKESPA